MPITDLKEIAPEFRRAVNAGDLDALCRLYTADSVFVPGGGAAGVAGAEAIRGVLAGFLSSRPSMEFEHTYIHVAGDTAVARGKWKLTSTKADGSTETVSGNSVEVLRRAADGGWRYLIDCPWGAD